MNTILSKLNIQAKLTLIMFLCILIPLITLGILSYNKSSEIVNSQFENYNKYAIRQLKLLLDTHLREMDSISRDVLAYLIVPSRHIPIEPVTYDEHLEQARFIEYLRLNLSPLVEGLFVITTDGHVFGNRTLHPNTLAETDWWRQMRTTRDSQWIGFHGTEYYGYPAPEGPLISLAVPVRLQAALPPDSVILVDVNAEPLQQMFHSFEQDTGSFLEITTPDGEPVYRTQRSYARSEDDLVWSEVSEVNGWQMSARIPHAEYRRTSLAIRTYALIVGAVALFVSLVLAQWFARGFARRIIRLNKSMLEVSHGKLETSVDADGNDELSRLAGRFNFMTRQIRMLVEDVARTEKQKTEAELQALHYQINPHLLLNTLNTIQWKARMSGQSEIDGMIYHLTEVLAESLVVGEELVTLRQELKTIDHYLHIQRFRYGDVFDYEEQVEPGMKDAVMPRMTLQPLVENIFYHAFVDGHGSIRLTGEVRSGTCELVLSDDGAGFAADQGEDAVRPFPARKGRGGIGLYNVDQKLKLHFGPAYGLRFHSAPGSGTVVKIVWPLRWKEELHAGT